MSLGSLLASAVISKSVPLLEGVLAFPVLALLQYALAVSAWRSRAVADAVKATPRALLIDGAFIEDALAAERVSRVEVEAAVCGSGLGALADVAAVVLETDGSLSVVARDKVGDRSAFTRVSNMRASR